MGASLRAEVPDRLEGSGRVSVRRGLLWVLLPLALLLALLLSAGHVLSRPVRASMPAPPPGFEAISLTLKDGVETRGWRLDGRAGQGAVLLLHGVRGNRLQMLRRAQWLQGQGLSVLLLDLPAHGESGGKRISFGWNERLAVQTAWSAMQQRWPLERKGVIGVSLGAAAFVFADVSPKADAVVLESMYPDLRQATDNRLRQRMGSAGAWLSPLLLVQMPLWSGLKADQLRPIDDIERLQAPLLLAIGAEDRHTTVDETRQLFNRAPMPYRLWIVPGAAHVDLMDFAPQDYAESVLGFLRARLQASGAGRGALGAGLGSRLMVR